MPDRPTYYLDTPDALSNVLARLELKAEIYANGDYCGTWALDTSGSRRIPFHLIGHGHAWLHLPEQNSQLLTNGDLVIFPHDAQHIISNSSQKPAAKDVNIAPNEIEGESTNIVCGFFEFQNKAAWPLLDSLPPMILLDLREQASNSRIRSLIEMMIIELKNEQQGYYAVINQLAYLLFIQIIRQQILSGNLQSGLLAAMFDPKLSKVLALIHNQPEKNWTLASLANCAAMGRSSFAQRFNELTGTSAMRYLGYWRMQLAKQLLSTTNQTMLEIAEQCGYQSEVAFRKSFKKIIGKPPGKIRRQ